MTHQENNENPIWFYNYYGSGFLTIVKHEIYETKVSEKRTLVNPFSETTPLLENSSNDNNNGVTDSYTAMFQNKDEKSQVSFILTIILKKKSLISKLCKYQACRPWVCGCAMANPDFGRSVNPISTRGDRLCPPNSTGTPKFSDLPTALSMNFNVI